MTRMRITRSIPLRVEIVALIVAITGMVVQIAAGVEYPTVPPGVVIIAAAALLLALVRWPGVRIVGALVPAFVLFGGLISPTGRTNISHPGHLGPFLGTLIQFAGLATALLAGIVALGEWRAARHAASGATDQHGLDSVLIGGSSRPAHSPPVRKWIP